MHTTGRDGSSRVTVIVTCTVFIVDQVITAQLAFDLPGAEPLRSDYRDPNPDRETRTVNADHDPTAAGCATAAAARSGQRALDHVVSHARPSDRSTELEL